MGSTRKRSTATRRDFLASSAAFAASGLAACDAGAGNGPDEAGADGEASPAAGASASTAEATPQTSPDITAATIAEAEKLHAITYTTEEREQLLQSISGQVAGVRQLRDVPRELALQPAITFDPRLPGVSYAPQENRVVLSSENPGALPANEADIAYASVCEQAHWVRTGQITSRRLTEIYLSRIERLAPDLYCYITVTADHALAQAAESDRELAAGRYRGELHGIPYGIKDCFDTAGIATTWGATPYRDQVPNRDARIVTMLRDAGAVLLGKLATASLANGYRWYGGKVRNPWNTEEHAGGSSAGPGSATAAALCSFSIGTDSLGSILNPADQCGVVGLRATFGRVPTAGAMPLTPSLDRIGPLTRRVEDAVPVMAAINGPDPTSASSIDMGFDYDAGLDPSTLRVGYSPDWFREVGFGPGATVPVADAHLEALEALRALGVEMVEVELPAFPYGALIPNLYVEAAAIYEELTLDGRDDQLPPEGWPDAWRRVRLLSAVDYLQAERLRRGLMHEFDRIYSDVDALFAPTYGSFELLMAMNYTGHPGIGLRAGLDESPTRSAGPVPDDPAGEPHTITRNVAFHGRLFEEGKILALARALEERLGVYHHRPPIG
ncbi:MAG: amidase [Gemmatimonadetes bacterium]|nr:amidase [Gemmatimonadota bacterium]